ncbi:MAG: DUF4388 domain-containing protein [bacterium]|nr:DUF4388 domain-containing protein [bacterium]
MNLEGDLKGLALPKVLQSLSAQNKSGILTVQGEDDIVAVSLLEGAIVAADALNQTVEEGLGEVLQSQDLISTDNFTAAVRDHQGGGSGSLGDMLVSRGMVSREELLEGLRLQTYRLMLQILTWRQGEFKFYSGDEVSYEEGFVPLSVEELLIRSIDDLGDKGGIAGPVPDLEAAYRRVPQRVGAQILGRDGDGSGGGIWISPEQESLMLKVSNQVSAASLAGELNLGRYQALFALYNLLHNDLIEHLGVPKASATALELPPIEDQIDEPLRAEIFTPPEPGDLDETATGAVRASSAAGIIQKLVGPLLAVALFAVLALAWILRPGTFLLPFPWQDNQRSTIERQLRQSLYLKLDRAAKTYFLVERHFPSTLEDLTELGFVSSADLEDQVGAHLTYSTDDVSYRIVPMIDGRRAQVLATTEAITGDFLLDPQFLRPPSTDTPPLYLLD